MVSSVMSEFNRISVCNAIFISDDVEKHSQFNLAPQSPHSSSTWRVSWRFFSSGCLCHLHRHFPSHSDVAKIEIIWPLSQHLPSRSAVVHVRLCYTLYSRRHHRLLCLFSYFKVYAKIYTKTRIEWNFIFFRQISSLMWVYFMRFTIYTSFASWEIFSWYRYLISKFISSPF